MTNELKKSHVVVNSFYEVIELLVSLGFIYLYPNTVAAHWRYLAVALVIGDLKKNIVYIIGMEWQSGNKDTPTPQGIVRLLNVPVYNIEHITTELDLFDTKQLALVLATASILTKSSLSRRFLNLFPNVNTEE